MGFYLRKIKDHYYAYAYERHRTPQRKSVPLGTKMKSAALTKFTKLKKEYEEGKFDPWAPAVPKQSPTFHEAALLFLDSRAHLRPHTRRAYSDVLRHIGDRLPANLLITDLSLEHLSSFVHDRSIARATQRKRYTHVRAFIRWALKSKLLERSPLEDLRQPKEERRVPEFLTPKQLERLLAAIRTDYEMKRAEGRAQPGQILWLADAVELAVATGMRRSELLALRWSSVDLESGLITLRNHDEFTTKSGHERAIPVVRQARDVLERLAAMRTDDLDGPVLTGEGGGRLYPNHVTRRFKYYIRLAKLDERFKFHSLRHTTASWLAQKGHSLQIIAAILGHSDTRVTQRYAHLAPQTLAEAMRGTFE